VIAGVSLLVLGVMLAGIVVVGGWVALRWWSHQRRRDER
jgi:hypothetical protein